MKELKIKLENCYGIKSLNHNFDFSSKSVYAIYAPNGIMKTSFARTFMDLSKGVSSKDLIFPERKTLRDILDENQNPVNKENIFVIEPYNKDFNSTETSTLLVNSKLKEKHDDIVKTIKKKKNAFLKALKVSFGLGTKTETIFSKDFVFSENQFYKSIVRIKEEVKEENFTHLENLIYKKIFNSKTEDFLKQSEIQEKLKDYVQKYNNLIDNSKYFKKGVFNHNNASVIAKNLRDNGFFEANHTVNFYSTKSLKTIKNLEELEELISEEKDAILTDNQLKIKFNEIDAQLSKHKDLKAFRNYLIANPVLLTELDNIPKLKQSLWIAYTQKNKAIYDDLIKEFEGGKIEIEKIFQKAKEEKTTWKKVVDIFNYRFSVPFKLIIQNQEDVILNSEAPKIVFQFEDSMGKKNVEKNELQNVLSNGELRALYILNIIFEIEARKANLIDTLFIVDDIADSFDYKNKYAIIEYLNDVVKEPYFYQIILTHNFDFFRTISSRLDMARSCKLNTVKNKTEVKLIEEKYQNNPFNHWKKNLASNSSMLIATIPFVRNIAEYSGDDANFLKLTSLLHIKHDTNSITLGDLEVILKSILKDKSSLSLPTKSKKVFDLVYEEAERIIKSTSEIIELEEKIVLAIAIRMKCEEFLIKEINNNSFINGIKKNQTRILYEKYKELNPHERMKIQIIEQVNLMTPENIHLNSFMYEPILDLSNEHLKVLYKNVNNI